MMDKINVGDVCRVKQSKYLPTGTIVKIVVEIQTGIFLCANHSGNTIIVEQNLKLIGGNK